MKVLRRQSRVPRRMLPAPCRCAPRADVRRESQDNRRTARVALTVMCIFSRKNAPGEEIKTPAGF
eukprot:4137823-Prymnesium_polylepis.1